MVAAGRRLGSASPAGWTPTICRRCWRAVTPQRGHRSATCCVDRTLAERAGGAGGGRVRRHVLGAEVAERLVGADRRPRPARSPRRRRARGARAPGAVRGDDPGPGQRPPPASRHARVDDGHVPPDHVAGRRPAAAHPRRDLGQGADRRRAVAGVGRPLPEAPPADAGRPVPVGAAGRAHPPLRGRLGADRQRPGRDRRHAARAAGGVLQAGRPGRRRAGRQGRRVPGPGGPGPDPLGAGGAGREASADTRAHKTGNGVADLRTRWPAEAAELGWTAGRLDRRDRRRRPRTEAPARWSRSRRCSISSRRRGRRGPGPTCCERSATSSHPCPRCRDADGRRPGTGRATRCIDHCVDLDPPTAQSAGGRRMAGRCGWSRPPPHFTSDAILAEEDTSWPGPWTPKPTTRHPSTTVDRDGLDVLQADAAAAVAGTDRLVLVVGPAGTGKTTMLRAGRRRPARMGPAGVRCGPDGQGGPCPATRDRHGRRHRRQAAPRMEPTPTGLRSTTYRLPAGTTRHRRRGRHDRHRLPAPARRPRRPRAVAARAGR